MKYPFLKLSLLLIVAFFITQSCDRTDDVVTVTDIDGNVYQTIKVGSQTWMLENLRTTKYNDGTVIPTGLNNTDWSSTTSGAYAIYNDDATNNTTYGKLYNWHAVNTGKLAPAGWHVATKDEYTTLIDALGGSGVAGGRMKVKSTLWDSPNTGATDQTSFKGLPGGYRGMGGGYSLEGRSGYWWTSTARNSTQGNYIVLDNDFESVNGNGATNTFGYSVRCVKD